MAQRRDRRICCRLDRQPASRTRVRFSYGSLFEPLMFRLRITRRARCAPPGDCRWRIPGASSRRGGPCPVPARPRPGGGARTRGRPEGQDALSAVASPALTGALHPRRHQDPVGGLHGSGTDRVARGGGVRVVHAVAVAAQEARLPPDVVGSPALRRQVAQRAGHPADAPGVVGSWGGTCRHLPDQAVPSAVSAPKAASAAALMCWAACRKPTGMTSGHRDSRKARLSFAPSATAAGLRSGLRSSQCSASAFSWDFRLALPRSGSRPLPFRPLPRRSCAS